MRIGSNNVTEENSLPGMLTICIATAVAFGRCIPAAWILKWWNIDWEVKSIDKGHT